MNLELLIPLNLLHWFI